jgi:hypothetical protein
VGVYNLLLFPNPEGINYKHQATRTVTLAFHDGFARCLYWVDHNSNSVDNRESGRRLNAGTKKEV